jgi:hypothetical protein
MGEQEQTERTEKTENMVSSDVPIASQSRPTTCDIKDAASMASKRLRKCLPLLRIRAGEGNLDSPTA